MTTGILNKAIQSAKKSKMYPYKIGCVIFKGKRILSYGYNQKRSSSKIPVHYRKFPETLHAEHHAITQVQDKSLLKGASMLVIRVTMGDNISLAKPCQNCMNSILFFGIKEIYYSNEKGEIILEKIQKEQI